MLDGILDFVNDLQNTFLLHTEKYIILFYDTLYSGIAFIPDQEMIVYTMKLMDKQNTVATCIVFFTAQFLSSVINYLLGVCVKTIIYLVYPHYFISRQKHSKIQENIHDTGIIPQNHTSKDYSNIILKTLYNIWNTVLMYKKLQPQNSYNDTKKNNYSTSVMFCRRYYYMLVLVSCINSGSKITATLFGTCNINMFLSCILVTIVRTIYILCAQYYIF